MSAGRLARAWIRGASLLVPRDRRAEWAEEWLGELRALEEAQARGVAGLPGLLGFSLGALPHALWTTTEGWRMDGVMQDVRFALRVLARSPGFTAVAALTLALGIGANASIFSLVNGLLFRAPAGIAEPERVVQIARSYETDPRWDNFSWPAMKLIESEARTLSGVAGYSIGAFVLGRGAETEQLLGQYVSGSYFEVLGVRPVLGRLIQPADDVEPGAHPVVVLGHGLWERRFGADPDVVGRTVSIGASPYTVIGVAPEGFSGPESIGTAPALWVPAMQQPGYYGQLPFAEWGWSWLNVVGHLAEDVTFEEARASMDVVTARLREAAPVNEEILVLMAQGVGLDPDARAQARTISLLLAMIVGVVLLLTCTNVANLFLARAGGRSTEVGVRLALGAGRTRVVRQLVTESLVLALLATALAVPVVLGAGRFLPVMFPYSLAISVGPDARVLAFLCGVGLLAGLLFGVVPAWVTARRSVTRTLREGAASAPPARTRLRNALVVVQLALSLGLVSGAALLGRSVFNAHRATPGFDPEGITVAYLDLESTGRYDREAGVALFDRLLREAGTIPGVSRVTIANQAPIVGGHSRATARPAGRDDVDYEAEYIIVGPDYFETLGVEVVEGRALRGVGEEPEPVVVVNEALASLFWPGESAVGKALEGEGGTIRVVGVARDVQMRSLRAAGRPAVYYPIDHRYSARMALHLRGRAAQPIPAARVRAAVAAVDPELPVAAVVDLRSGVTASMAETRTIGYLVAAFAVLALVLASVGLYGLVAFGVSQRVREIGIRIALGALPGSLVRSVLIRAIAISALGVVLGLGLSYALGNALQGLLFQVPPGDAGTLGAAALSLLLTAGLAAWLPARRAARVDAAVSLRDGPH